MIGVHATEAGLETAAEFFELFKTPWEPAVPGRRYPALLSDTWEASLDAELVLVYSSREEGIDRAAAIRVAETEGPLDVDWDGRLLPLYGRVALFTVPSDTPSIEYQSQPVCHTQQTPRGVVRHVGYDLLGEVRHLLTQGQPASRAMIPALELHIDFLRQSLIQAGIPFVEVPPRPEGAAFVCCLTHDLDFFGIRRHRLDSTLAGFFARGSLGTLIDLLRGRRSLAEALRNWIAVLSVPLVFLRLLPDFWRPVDEYRAADIERATFFVVPFKGRCGMGPDGAVDRKRAVPYQASEVRADLLGAMARGQEIGLHGIDAWRGEAEGRAESAAIASAVGRQPTGVRMHWLYFSPRSPEHLEAAGFAYDSTWGYNDAVGYRAGTSQVFRFPTTRSLLELPLSIMDSALFYRHRMHLRHDEALNICRGIIENARRFGGTVVVNWHDRSLAPERLWGRAYHELQQALASPGAWFATAGEAVEWFRWRRSIRFSESDGGAAVTVVASGPRADRPAVVLVHNRPAVGPVVAVERLCFDGRIPLCVKFA